MAKQYRVWVHVEVEEDDGEYTDYDLPDCIGLYDDLDEAIEAAAQCGADIQKEESE